MSFHFGKKRPRILVTGALGRLASHAIDAIDDEFECVLTDIGETGGRDAANYIQADLTDYAQVRALMPGIDGVIHLAIASKRSLGAPVSSEDLLPFDEMTIKVNVLGTFHVLEAARRAGIRRVVYLSSMTAYHGDIHKPLYDEHTPLDPQNLYACTKIFGENLAAVFSRNHGMSVICLRIGQPFPSHSSLDDRWRSSKRARSHYLAVQDMAQAVRCGLTTEIATGVFNIVSSSDNQRVDLSHAAELGYRPKYHFSDAGLSVHEDGEVPLSPGPIVTHDGTET